MERSQPDPPVVVLDVANVVGSRPDGWWHDRAGAAERALADAQRVLAAGGATAVLAVLEGRSRSAAVPAAPGLEAVLAPGEGDDTIVEVTEGAVDALALVGAGPADVVVVTADRGLRERLPGAVSAVGPRWWFDLVGASGG